MISGSWWSDIIPPRNNKCTCPSAFLPPFALSIPLTKTHPSCLQVAFLNEALASAEEEQARLRGQLREQKARCWRLTHLAAPSQSKPEQEALVPRSESDSISVESHQAIQVPMEKLQVSKCFLMSQEEWG